MDIILYFLHSIVLLLCVMILNARGKMVVRLTLEKMVGLVWKFSTRRALV